MNYLNSILNIIYILKTKLIKLFWRIPKSFFIKFKSTDYDDKIYRDIIYLSNKIGSERSQKRLLETAIFWDESSLDNSEIYNWKYFYNAESWGLKAKILSILSTDKNLEFSKTHYYSIKELSNRDKSYFSIPNNLFSTNISIWTKYYGYVSIMMLSNNMRAMAIDIFRKYNEWAYEWNFWSLFISGSSASSINGGLALHFLIKYLIERDDKIKMKSLKNYNKYLKRYIHHVQLSFDNYKGFSSPHEGIKHGIYQFKSASILGIIQKKLGIFSILDMPEIKNFINYIDMSITPDKDYHPSGDARGIDLQMNLILALKLFSENEGEKIFLNSILDNYIGTDDFYLRKIFNYKFYEIQFNRISKEG